MITSGYSHGYAWKYSQPVIDAKTAGESIGLTVYGLGDDDHWLGCGDHVSNRCSGHLGWITAFDVMAKSGVFDPVDCATRFLLPILKADPAFYPWFKYMITDYKLWDRRPGYDLRQQEGGDDAGHLHVSCTNNMGLRCTFIQDYQEWKSVGRPPVVAWFRNRTTAMEGDSAVAVTMLADGKPAAFVIGTDRHPYFSRDGWKTAVELSEAEEFANGATIIPFRSGALAFGRRKNKEIVMFHIPTPNTPKAGYRVQGIGGRGDGTPSGVVMPNGDIYVEVKGTMGGGAIYTKTIHPNGTVVDWMTTPMNAKAL